MSSKTDQEMQREAYAITYDLRTSFFFRKLSKLGYFGFGNLIQSLCATASLYSWEDRIHWRVSNDAWETLARADIAPLKVFAHPKVLMEHPKLIRYYRNVAAISQKGVGYLTFDVAGFESGTKQSLSYKEATKLAKLFNLHISSVLESTTGIAETQITGLMYASAGTGIQGSWNNKVGQEAATRVNSYLIRHALSQQLIAATIDRQGNHHAYSQKVDYIRTVDSYQGVKLSNGWTIKFGSEPDVTFLSSSGVPECVIEVKGGVDPAGALERLGAIFKSFEAARNDNPAVRTVLVASCITGQMGKRLERNALVDSIYNLTKLMLDLEDRERFIAEFSDYFES